MYVLMPSCHWRPEEEIMPRGRMCRSELPDMDAEMQSCVLYNSSACSQPLCNLSSHACCSLNQDSTSLYSTHFECAWTVENEGNCISGHSN